VTKWRLAGLAAVVGLTTSLLACENSPTPVHQQLEPVATIQRGSVTSTARPVVMLKGQSIGDIHNEAMDAVLHALVRANRTGKLNARAGCQIARAALAQYFREKGLLNGSHQRQIDNGLLNAGLQVGTWGRPRRCAGTHLLRV
jgi:hypothetical protein